MAAGSACGGKQPVHASRGHRGVLMRAEADAGAGTRHCFAWLWHSLGC
ncbi:hypothetical protein XCR_3380 [Xanthomonas campestris pv. raphani 756C]|nr:hypothetical protein XCR_3380 [Xanthomonas campestris pv. raphani 756C]